MTLHQLASIAVCIAITLLLYCFGRTQTPLATAFDQHSNSAEISKEDSLSAIVSLKERYADALTIGQKDSLALLNGQIANINTSIDFDTNLPNWRSPINRWRVAQLFIIKQAEHAVNSNLYQDWNAVANGAYDVFRQSQDSLEQAIFTDLAIKAYKQCLSIESDSLQNKVRLASCLVEGKNDVMQGVFMLRDLVEKDPNNFEANLILGRLSVFSRQFTKAEQRLAVVLQQDSLNSEALYYMGETLMGLEREGEALKYFEKCKQIINDPVFNKELELYISKIKTKNS